MKQSTRVWFLTGVSGQVVGGGGGHEDAAQAVQRWGRALRWPWLAAAVQLHVAATHLTAHSDDREKGHIGCKKKKKWNPSHVLCRCFFFPVCLSFSEPRKDCSSVAKFRNVEPLHFPLLLLISFHNFVIFTLCVTSSLKKARYFELTTTHYCQG